MTSLARFIKIAAAVSASIVFSGCALNMKVPVKEPVPSSAAYRKSGNPAPVALAFKDERAEADKANVVTGRIPMHLVEGDKPLDPTAWVARQVVKEMVARGLPVSQATGGAGTPVAIKNLRIDNHRATGFSPFVTFTFVRADVTTPRGTERLTSVFRRGKVPVMSFDEVIDPTYNDQLGIVTKELAAKLNQALFGQSVSNEAVDALVAKVNKEAATSNTAYWDVLELGFGNNPRAVPELVKLVRHSNEYVRMAAISSIGTLRAQDQFDLLTKLYESTEPIWQDRLLALKAIGDLGGAKSRAYLEQQQKALAGKTDRESLWLVEVIKLYL